MKYRRILLKMSGEALAGERGFGIDAQRLRYYAEEIRSVVQLGVQVAVVIGGGNLFRGIEGSEQGLDRAQADYMGMLATVINGLARLNALEQLGVPARVQSAIEMNAGMRAVYPAAGYPPLRKERVTSGHLCRRHGQSLLYDRYGGHAPSY